MIPRSIAVVSGKGGAGKTMLSMAITHELAIRARTLIVDLDVFNRGLSGLLKQGKKISDVPIPEFFSGDDTGSDSGEWRLIQVAPNVVTLLYPDVTRAQRQNVESRSIAELTGLLEGFIQQLIALSDCHAVVLDCHGGPDMLSFAATSMAAHTILVSEPDRITFFGTLHFLRRMAEDCPCASPDVRLVFNKVMPAFSGNYLRKFYSDHVRELFQGRELLGIVPFEAYLSKEFERFPFVTQVYPFSQLADKVRRITRELNIEGDAKAASAPRRFKEFLDEWLGGGSKFVPKFMNMDVTLTITAVGLTLMVFVGSIDAFGLKSFAISYFGQVAEIIASWFAAVVVVNWMNVLDRFFTREFRRRGFLTATVLFLTFEALALLPALLTGVLLGDALRGEGFPEKSLTLAALLHVLRPRLTEGGVPVLIMYVTAAISGWVIYNELMRAAIGARHERRYVEALVRLLGCVSSLIVTVFFAYIVMH